MGNFPPPRPLQYLFINRRHLYTTIGAATYPRARSASIEHRLDRSHNRDVHARTVDECTARPLRISLYRSRLGGNLVFTGFLEKRPPRRSLVTFCRRFSLYNRSALLCIPLAEPLAKVFWIPRIFPSRHGSWLYLPRCSHLVSSLRYPMTESAPASSRRENLRRNNLTFDSRNTGKEVTLHFLRHSYLRKSEIELFPWPNFCLDIARHRKKSTIGRDLRLVRT